MATIRSAPPPMIPPRSVADARAAFFRGVNAPDQGARIAPQAEAAQAQVPASAQPRAPAVATQPVQQQAPTRILRPGSIIDIKV